MIRVSKGSFSLALLVAALVHIMAMVALPFIVGPTTAQLPLPVTVTLSVAMAPPPPPPPAPPPPSTPANPTPRKRVERFDLSRLTPREIMTDEEELVESTAAPMVGGVPGGVVGGVPGGVVGGVPGGMLGGLIGEIAGKSNSLVPPPPPPPAPEPEPEPVPERIQVRGDHQKARLLVSSAPDYPPLAVQLRVQGTVSLQAVIGRTGEIEELQVLSGHALLVEAALAAVRRWRYEPTLINGKPVEVLTQIDVHFRLPHF